MISRTQLCRICIAMGALSLASCSIGRFIPEDEVLYTGASIQTDPEADIEDLKALERELQTVVQPRPNSKFLGMRPGLHYYYKAQKEKPGFLIKWLNKKFGEAPVYLSDVNPEQVEELIQNRLENKGFFYSSVQSELDSSNRYARIQYRATIPSPYTLEALKLDRDSLPIYNRIDSLMNDTEIRPGARFDLDLLKYERKRIDQGLKQTGYYNFNPDFLIFEADTNRYDDKRFDLFLRLKRGTPDKALIPYVIDSITVYPNYSIMGDSLPDGVSTTSGGLYFKQEELYFKPGKLEPYILLQEGQHYDAGKARVTSNRLTALGNYKFVNIRFTERDTLYGDGEGSLFADLFLSPLTKRSLRAELQAVTKSNGFTGPGIVLTYNNRNLFKGGETLSLSGNFAYEAQISNNNNSGLTSIAAGLKADLVIPSLVPFSPDKFKYAVPKTKISLGGDILKRSKLYTLTSINTSYGYTWKANRFVNHELNPISVNIVDLSDTTAEFDSILAQNPYLRRSFEQQFIAGVNYTFTYNEWVDDQKKQPVFFSTSLDLAGNGLNLLSGGNDKVFGLEYAQYLRADADVRYYFRLRNEQVLVGRVYGGWGIPYGNSTTLPFVKQFFSGGPYSVRAFQIRSLGPGTFRSEEEGSSAFFDQSGNLRLEANMEYRFPIFSYLKGALFVDAGNVWLTNEITPPEDESDENQDFSRDLFEQGKFDSDWLKELGIGLGFGLRIDIQSFVIRFDLASPIQVPYLPEGERGRIPFFGGGDNNLVFNFAIGYPF